MRKVCVATLQMACTANANDNLLRAELLVREAAAQGGQIILLQELFETLYFCQKEKLSYCLYATELEVNPAILRFQAVARELKIVLPISFYELKNNVRYNSVAVIDADGEILGVYRKSHIPDGPGYEEKFYFNPGDTGFKVWKTRYGRIGVGICWDQWFPEAARCMVLMGAEILFYPTAIGSEPEDVGMDSVEHWKRCMQGHSAANIVPVVAANRIGAEREDEQVITFYGHSFITNAKGELMKEAGRKDEAILLAEFDLNANALERMDWAVFRDRRPELYGPLLTYDGHQKI